MAKPNVRQIASLAQVSPATVSRVMNGTAQVSDQLRQRVLSAAAQLGYESPAALAGKGSHLIGLLTPSMSNPFYAEVMEGILETAADAGYSVVLCPTTSSNILDYDDHPPPLEQRSLAGMISLSRLRPGSTLLQRLPSDLPIVQCCEYDEDLPYPIVAIDNYAAAYHATTYLLDLGYRSLAIFNSTCHTLYGKLREKGFRDALQDQGVPLREDWVLHLGKIDYNLSLAAAQNLFSKEERPDAVFTVSDVYAAGITRSLAQLGLRVPEDVSVVGFDDTNVALINTPTLTTIRQPRYKLGATACNVLLRLIRSGTCPSRYFMVESDLIVRKSTQQKRPPGNQRDLLAQINTTKENGNK